MASYKCSVIDSTGKKIRLSQDAESKSELIEYLKKNYYVIVDIKEKDSLNVSRALFKIQKIKAKDLSVFCKQLHAMIKAGVTIVNSLEILRQQTENKRLRRIVGQMYEDLQKGNTFSEALSSHADAFPDIFISMVQAGEISGNIDIIMDRLSKHFEKEHKIENKIKSAMTYPAILAIVASAVVVFLLTTVMPTFVEMYSSSGVPLPTLTKVFIAISEALKRFWYIFIIVIILAAAALSQIKKIDRVRLKSDYYKLHVPVYKSMALKVATSRFTRTLSTLLGSGVPLLQAMDTVAGVTGNVFIGSKILEAKEDVRRGLSLSQPLKMQGIFPPMVHSMIKIGEDTGSIEEILDKTADFYDEEVETSIQRLTTMLEPLMIVFMAVIIGFIVLAMVLPMFDMVKTVG